MMTSREPSLIILLFVVSFASITNVLFAPALPQMAQEMDISNGQAQVTMSVFLVGYALGVLPYGPLSNRFGRKSALYIGSAIALMGSLFTFAAVSLGLYPLVLVGRILMAFGCSAGLKVAFTIIGDVYHKADATKKLSSILLAFAIAPSVGIALGGVLTEQFGWKSCFLFTVIYCVFIFVISFFLPETLQKPNPQALSLIQIKNGLLPMFKNRKIVYSGLLIGCGASANYLFATIAPFIGIDVIGLSPEQYGLWNFIPSLGVIIGSFVGQALSSLWPPGKVILWGIYLAIAVALAMLFFFLVFGVSLWALFFPMLFFYIGCSLVYSNASSIAMTHIADKSNASAVMHFLNVGLGAITLLFIEAVSFQQPFILPLSFTVLGVIMIFLHKRLVLG